MPALVSILCGCNYPLSSHTLFDNSTEQVGVLVQTLAKLSDKLVPLTRHCGGPDSAAAQSESKSD